MKKINWKILSLAFCIEIALSYILPFNVINNFQYQAGFPAPFISLYANGFNINPFMSMHLNPAGLLFNVIIIYFIITVCMKAYRKFRYRQAK